MAKWGRGSLNQSDRIAKRGCSALSSHSRHDHLGRDDLSAVPLHAANCGLLALRLTRAESVPYDVNLPSSVEQTENGLQHAHMGLAAGNHDVPARGIAPRKSGSRTASNVILCKIRPASIGRSSTVAPRPFAFCSVNTIGHVDQLGHVDKPLCVLHRRPYLIDRRHRGGTGSRR